MSAHIKKATLAQGVTVTVFALFAIGMLLAFGYYTFDVSKSLLLKEQVIEFNKGAMYMLGVGLGSGLLVIFMIHELSEKRLSDSYNKKATKAALLSIGLLFVFPQLADYAVTSKAESMGYVPCNDLSYRWLHAQKKVFVVDGHACTRSDVTARSSFKVGIQH